MSMDQLSERRRKKVELKAQYQDGLSALMDPVTASWRELWVADCREKGRTVPFSEWCQTPLVEGDPMSSPFEIANVYE